MDYRNVISIIAIVLGAILQPTLKYFGISVHLTSTIAWYFFALLAIVASAIVVIDAIINKGMTDNNIERSKLLIIIWVILGAVKIDMSVVALILIIFLIIIIYGAIKDKRRDKHE